MVDSYLSPDINGIWYGCIVPERVLPSNRLANGDVPLHGVANFREFEVKKIFVQLTPNNSNLQGKSKKVRVIGSSKKIAGSKEKTVFTAQ